MTSEGELPDLSEHLTKTMPTLRSSAANCSKLSHQDRVASEIPNKFQDIDVVPTRYISARTGGSCFKHSPSTHYRSRHGGPDIGQDDFERSLLISDYRQCRLHRMLNPNHLSAESPPRGGSPASCPSSKCSRPDFPAPPISHYGCAACLVIC